MTMKEVDYDYLKLRSWGIGALTALKMVGMAWTGISLPSEDEKGEEIRNKRFQDKWNRY